MKKSMKSARYVFTSAALTLASLMAIPAFAGQYVGSYNCGIAKGWPVYNTLYPSNSTCQVVLVLNRTTESDFESRGTVTFSVDESEGQSGPFFEGTYVRRGNSLSIDFFNRTYHGYRSATIFESQNGTKCISAKLSTSRQPMIVCEGLIGL